MIGEKLRSKIIRDSKDFYRAPAGPACASLLDFARKRAGRSILDLGCATGQYSLELARAGFQVKGADINPEYVAAARERGVDAYLSVNGLCPFEDKSFDTVILFETLEHVAEPDPLLAEARRLARKNVLITVPNCEGAEKLQKEGLLFEHFADLDHKNFFTPVSLEALLSKHFSKNEIALGDPLSPAALIGNPGIRFLIKGLKRIGLVRHAFYFRLFAEASI